MDTSEAAVEARKTALAGGKDGAEEEDKMAKMAAKMDKMMEKSSGKKAPANITCPPSTELVNAMDAANKAKVVVAKDPAQKTA